MHKKNGFTLIEVLTVVLILGILTSVALPQYTKAVRRAEAANALINLRTIFDSAKRYKATHSAWPTAFNQLDVDLFDISADGNMGDFQYSFSPAYDGTLSACRLKNGSTDTYCLNAYYRWDGKRDVYSCTFQSDAYKSLCESLGTQEIKETPDGQYIIH